MNRLKILLYTHISELSVPKFVVIYLACQAYLYIVSLAINGAVLAFPAIVTSIIMLIITLTMLWWYDNAKAWILLKIPYRIKSLFQPKERPDDEVDDYLKRIGLM